MTVVAKWTAAFAMLGMLASPVMAQAQASPPATPLPSPMTRIEAPAEPQALPLYPQDASTRSTEIWVRVLGQRYVRNVSRPTIKPYLPEPGKATGAAVIVAPGGAFKVLSIDNEGWNIGQWLADHGVAAFVLKYRLNETPGDDTTFLRELMAIMATAGANGGDLDLAEPRATQDGLAALALVRSNAAKWGVDEKRVGMIGFSAGAITTLNTVLEGQPAQQPAFVGYIYGPMTGVVVPANAPPMFAAIAVDDPLFGNQGYGLVEGWHKARRPVELHAYEAGGHGFGAGKAGTTTTQMMDQFLAWLKARGLLAGK